MKRVMTKLLNLPGVIVEDSKETAETLILSVRVEKKTAAWLQGEKISNLGKSSYICRPKETERTRRRHSKFWVGLYGHNWIVAFHKCQELVEELVASQ